MAALTNGGFGRIEDITEQRAVDNMIRDGRDPDLARVWTKALIIGGETDSTALDLIRRKDTPIDMTCEAVDVSTIPTDLTFRDAWRFNNGFYIDMQSAKEFFAARLVSAREIAITTFRQAIDKDILLGRDTKELEAIFIAIKNFDLHSMRDKISSIKDPLELKDLWPSNILHPKVGLFKN